MSDDIDLKALEAAEKELNDELEREAKATPPCPNCASTQTVRESRAIPFVLMYSLTVICAFWFFFVNVVLAFILVFFLSPALVIAIATVLYRNDFCCSDCGVRFKGKLIPRFI